MALGFGMIAGYMIEILLTLNETHIHQLRAQPSVFLWCVFASSKPCEYSMLSSYSQTVSSNMLFLAKYIAPISGCAMGSEMLFTTSLSNQLIIL